MEELTLREIQLGSLEILKKLDKICRENNIKYFLFYGTLIGAIRHKGFIPWDDDIDIAMPRDEYDKLINLYNSNSEIFQGLKLFTHNNTKNYYYSISRLSDVNYKNEYNGIKDYGLGLFIDIYPLDGVGNDLKKANKIMKKNARLTPLISLGNRKFVSSKKGFIRTTFKFCLFIISKILGIKRMVKIVDNKKRYYKFDESKYVVCGWDPIDYGTKKYIYFEKEWFDDIISSSFEDCIFPIPAQYDIILKSYYGNYMKLPPKELQVNRHDYKVFRK